ncbi:pyruvate kinase [Gelidibacter sp.]|uniref:pyruvate kinase n=1 Tax=Gelidibacter sp. TaxID=2018083 RepID=UPI0032639953
MNLKKLEKGLEKIYESLLSHSPENNTNLTVDPRYAESAINLYRYLVLRSMDIRKIQGYLSELGISSLGSGAGYTLSNVSNALMLIKLLRGISWEKDQNITTIGYFGSQKLLQEHVNALFKSNKKAHSTEIMVTMPDEAADNSELLKDLIQSGMNIARINLSHGDVSLWKKMLTNIHAVSETLEQPVKIYMDLPGPKIRIAEIFSHNKKDEKWKTKSSLNVLDGDFMYLKKEDNLNTMVLADNTNELPQITVTLSQIIDDLEIGHRVFFDDGAIEAVAVSKTTDKIRILIKKAHKTSLKLDKGINLPDTSLTLPSLTPDDIELLPFVSKHADMLGYSFVRKAADVTQLYNELDKLDNTSCGVVFKIENKEAFENLPLILFEAMKNRNIGVMIARGDLAVEVGFDRISEVQDQILLLCEAAHIPVIWATQVLDNLAKKGIATRAEISDATISGQAECVMLNKGPHITEAVKVLANILKRMSRHKLKKKPILRALDVAKNSLSKINEN